MSFCDLCHEAVVAGPNPDLWGFKWDHEWLHYRCIEQAHAAMVRIRAADAEEDEGRIAYDRANRGPE